jgi:pyruvate dehydrogenase E2 component (dihydrolipoamide acetyltransferase)
MALVMMPALSPTMTEGKLAKWLMKEGDAVRTGDVIAEIETDKAVMEVEALDDGVLAKITIAEGAEGVAVGAVIAEILADGEDSTLNDALPKSPAPVGIAPVETAPVGTAPIGIAPVGAAPVGTAPPKPVEAVSVGTEQVAAGTSRIFASPLARRVADGRGIDLASLKGSGPKGRIILADVEQAGAGQSQSVASTIPNTIQGVAHDKGSDSTVIENSQMRMIIADRLQQSKQDAPHFYLNMDIDIGAMLAARKALNDHAPEGVKISVNDMIIKAAATALMRVPTANASWEGAQTRLWHHADISVAVAIDGGLVTPIIRHAEEKGLTAISTEMADLAARARSGKLTPEEFSGGSFTISNLGMYGLTSFSAVINPPQGAILAIGAGEERAVVRGGEVAVAMMMTATLSCDHRVVDGAVGAAWLKAFKQVVENPVLALA